ncbi:MAG: threonine synthase [Alphaproteobacteria bacterium]|nr:threonine synthase [Alphaproteobacteria bacterium]
MHLRCVDCSTRHPAEMLYACTACGGILEVADPAVLDPAAAVTLGEGDTPLHRADRLAAAIGFAGTVLIKDETVNPTGSFKDRAVAAAVSRARAMGLDGIVCASSGNAGASAAAYAARAGLPCIVVVPALTPSEKVTQIAAYGALLLQVEGHYSNSYRVGLEIARRHRFANVTTTYLNPWGVDALKTVGRELHDATIGAPPDWVLVPTGAGPLVKGVVQGFRERAPARMPRLAAVQAAGCAPVVRAFAAGERVVRAWGAPTTFASGISDPLIGYERDGTHTLDLVRATGGLAVAVSDAAIRSAMQALARFEGILAEPTGASSVAALATLAADGRVAAGARVACLVTGHGFKDLKAWRELPAHTRRLATDEDPAGAVDAMLAERAAQPALPRIAAS